MSHACLDLRQYYILDSKKMGEIRLLPRTDIHMTTEQFLHEKYRSMALVDVEPSQLLEKFDSYEPPTIKSYISEKQV